MLNNSKYTLFFISGILLIIAETLIKFIWESEEQFWQMQYSNIAAAVLAGWIWEEWSESVHGIRLKLLKKGKRPLSQIQLFFFGMGVLSTGIWAGHAKFLNSKSAIDFYLDVVVIYMLAAAFFETCNLIKVEVRK